MQDLPAMGEGEVMAKGNLGFPKILPRRAERVACIYDAVDQARIAAK